MGEGGYQCVNLKVKINNNRKKMRRRGFSVVTRGGVCFTHPTPLSGKECVNSMTESTVCLNTTETNAIGDSESIQIVACTSVTAARICIYYYGESSFLR